MADLSEFRGVLVAVSFLSVFGILIAGIPSEFNISESSTRILGIPDYFEASQIQSFAETYDFNFTSAGGSTGAIEFGGYYFHQFWLTGGSSNYSYIYRMSKFWIFYHFEELGEFFHNGISLGDTLYQTRLDSDYAEGNVSNLKYTVTFGSTTQMIMFFSFNTSTYGSPMEAWANDELSCLWAMAFDQLNTSYNAWDLIAMLLFYEVPNVHTVLNIFIKIPIWICIVYLTYSFIKGILPFISS